MTSHASAAATDRARFPITSTSSASGSSRAEIRGRTTSSPGPTTAAGGLRNSSGSSGTAFPNSAACEL